MHIRNFNQTLLFFIFVWLSISSAAYSESVQPLDKKLHHLRVDGDREWSRFLKLPESSSLILKFDAEKNQKPWAIQLRQQDVKEQWSVTLNDKRLGKLLRDEKDTIRSFVIPAKALQPKENILKIEQAVTKRSKPDDIRVGEVMLYQQSLKSLLSESSISIKVIDDQTSKNIPCRVTITRADGSFPPLERSLTITLQFVQARFIPQMEQRR